MCNTFDGLVDAYVVDELNISPNKFNIADLKGKHPHLQNIYFPLLQDNEIGILVGTVLITLTLLHINNFILGILMSLSQ